ncbi:hypothetical protein BHE74_00023664 [Ensete ventricosum]|nr:hypothetical protein BHE74_00023664 [Ensete ventricosum]
MLSPRGGRTHRHRGRWEVRTRRSEWKRERPGFFLSRLMVKRRQRLTSLVLGNLSREILYPYIPDTDGEDEGGQASSSLAVSTQWISTAKLLQSDLATLTQKEGGE